MSMITNDQRASIFRSLRKALNDDHFLVPEYVEWTVLRLPTRVLVRLY